MQKKRSHRILSTAVSAAVEEEIARLAKANKVTKSQMIRQLLEEKLTERANERLDDAYTRLEQRMTRIEERFSALIVKNIRVSAQGLYLTMKGLEQGHAKLEEEAVERYWEKSLAFAGKVLESPAKKKKKEAESE